MPQTPLTAIPTMPIEYSYQDHYSKDGLKQQRRRLVKARPSDSLGVRPGARRRTKSQGGPQRYDDYLPSPISSEPESIRSRLSRYRDSYANSPNTPSSVSFYGTPLNSPVQPSEPPERPSAILFYHSHDPHYGFTNFSPHPVIYDGKRYPTSEHLFQSFKFQKYWPGLAEHIRTCSERPSVAFSEARRFQPQVRKDWIDVNIDKMDITLWYKFTQHDDLRDELLATGDAKLIEDSDKDSFWGIGADGQGRNELGKALERLRDKLRMQIHA